MLVFRESALLLPGFFPESAYFVGNWALFHCRGNHLYFRLSITASSSQWFRRPFHWAGAGTPIFTCTSGSPSPPARHSGYCTRSRRGFPIRQAGWEPCFISPAAGGVNPPGGRVRLRRTPERRTAPMPLRGSQGPRRGNYLYFRLSITANSSHRLLYSFSAWPLTQW